MRTVVITMNFENYLAKVSFVSVEIASHLTMSLFGSKKRTQFTAKKTKHPTNLQNRFTKMHTTYADYTGNLSIMLQNMAKIVNFRRRRYDYSESHLK